MGSFHEGLENEILKLSNYKKNGFYVDIGAYDGVNGSNTEFLEKLGWDGICIEPLKGVFDKLVKNRNCTCLNCAIWTEDNIISFMSLSGYTEMLSGVLESYDERHLLRIKNELSHHGGNSEIIKVQSKTFDSVIKQTDIDFISLDTEGAELGILQSIDFNKFNINLICVENNYNEDKIQNFLIPKGYDLVKTFNVDQLFLRKKFE